MRKQYEAAFKAKVALDALKGDKMIVQIVSETGFHPNQIRQCELLDLSRSSRGVGLSDAASEIARMITTGRPSMHLQRVPQLSKECGPPQ